MHLQGIAARKSVSHHLHLLSRGKPAGGIWRYRDDRDGLNDEVYGDSEILEIDRAMGSINFGHPGVDRHHLSI